MIRPVLFEIGIFLIPFAVFAAYLVATQRKIFEKQLWPLRTVLWLAIAAFLLTIASLIMLAHFSGQKPDSTYVPARMEDGKLIRGGGK